MRRRPENRHRALSLPPWIKIPDPNPKRPSPHKILLGDLLPLASGKRRTLESASPPTSKKAKGGSQAESMGQIHTSPHGSVHPSSNRKAASTSASGSDVAMADLRVDPSFVKMIVEYSKVALLEEEREGKNAGSEPVRKTRHPLTGTFVRGLLSSEFDTFECLSAWVMDCLFLGFFSS